MDALGALADGSAATAALRPLVDEYRSWISAQHAAAAGLTGGRSETADRAAADRRPRRRSDRARDRRARVGPDALDAFRLANRAVAAALRRRLEIASARWRAFQLAFILLNLPGIADPTDPERETVELLFFPTGGGKTEAYLGLAAFTLVLRRAAQPRRAGGLRVSVTMRYTLRLLTLDQLARAAGLVCALELERAERPKRSATWPFEIGLWVGRRPPRTCSARRATSDPTRRGSRFAVQERAATAIRSPIPLEEMPVVRRALRARLVQPLARRRPSAGAADRLHEPRLRLQRRPRAADRRRRLADLPTACPAFLIATVDKFAAMPWIGPGRARCFGGADRHDAHGFYGPARAGRGTPLPRAAAAAGSRHPGRAAPDLRPPGDDGRALRDGDRGAVRPHPPQHRRVGRSGVRPRSSLDGDRAPRE